MKTQILVLDPHDDVISARDKMGWGQTGRILLVWPERGRVLTRRLDLVLIQRHSQNLGAQLALVTADSDVLFHARQLGIPVFKTLRQAQRRYWRLPRGLQPPPPPVKSLPRPSGRSGEPSLDQLPPQPQRPDHQLHIALRLALFTLGVLAVLAIAAVLAPGAAIELQPQRQTQEITFNVQANPRLTGIAISGLLPARPTTVVVEGRDSLPSSGSIRVAQDRARGHVRFTNLTDEPVSIPAGTVVRTIEAPTLRFATRQAGEVPAGGGQTLDLPVEALLPGSQGNLPAGSLAAVEGALGAWVAATNPEPTAWGKDRQDPAPEPADRERLAGRLQASLQETALTELRSRLAPGDLLLPSSLTLERTLEAVYDPPDVQPADLLSLSLRLEFSALVVAAGDLQALAAAVLDANLPPGFTPLPGTVAYENLTLPGEPGAAAMAWEVRATRQLEAQLPAAQAIHLALGLPPTEAGQRLADNLPLAAPPQIALTPDWWPRLPVTPFRITVNHAHSGR